MAPEQITGRAGTAADVFTWAVTVAFAAGGRAPFGTGASDAIMYRIMHAAAGHRPRCRRACARWSRRPWPRTRRPGPPRRSCWPGSRPRRPPRGREPDPDRAGPDLARVRDRPMPPGRPRTAPRPTRPPPGRDSPGPRPPAPRRRAALLPVVLTLAFLLAAGRHRARPHPGRPAPRRPGTAAGAAPAPRPARPSASGATTASSAATTPGREHEASAPATTPASTPPAPPPARRRPSSRCSPSAAIPA